MITNQTPQADIDLWTDNALLWLDISSLSDRSRLPCRIEAGLKNARQTPSGLFELPYVESAANLFDIMSTTIRLPSLRSFRTLTAWNARSISLPLLQHGNLLQTHEAITELPGSIREVRALHVGWPHYSSRSSPAFRYI